MFIAPPPSSGHASITRDGFYVVQTGIGDRELNDAELEKVQGYQTLAVAKVAVRRAQGWDPLRMELHCKAARDSGECLVADLYMESSLLPSHLP